MMKNNFNHIQEENQRINPDNFKFGFFYFNKKDSRTIVPKWQQSRGWTINFANPYGYLFILAILAIILISIFLV